VAVTGILTTTVSGELRMTVQIIQFTDGQDPRDLAPAHGDIEARLAETEPYGGRNISCLDD